MKTKLLLILLFISALANGQQLSEQAEISVLTCQPGTDLYSVFGHTAIRVYDPGRVDHVYNYGTFDFNDEFYLKFARGKLNYRLSRSSFGQFNYEYTVTERGVEEQMLNLTQDQKNRFNHALVENYKPENQYYQYDFFYDNCATRIRDILEDVLGDELQWNSEFDHESYTFRDMIDMYLVDMNWSDFGIDIALGQPCDKVLEAQDNMFLPDYVFSEIASATIGGQPLVKETKVVIKKAVREAGSPLDPALMLTMALTLLALFWFWRRRKGSQSLVIPRFLFIFLGLAGLMVFLLWFATDHTTTKQNWNLIWAFPLHLIVAFILKKKRLVVPYMKAFTIVYIIVLIFGFLFPQRYHLAFYPLALMGAILSFGLGFLPSGKTQ
ncbi:Lnb N-terminal periplasmic domain-containing protein [Sanyastnella coralliicola]|uniref:Lnb N-terminal periplasmic domain-containing protein n=1 Tax=Sanyastnella coralliicola TaxID=3069118 RepID=UPI0027B9A295|nr:DUF4105 domain-containing protein [Longitalea sp. SCSIO 12813]